MRRRLYSYRYDAARRKLHFLGAGRKIHASEVAVVSCVEIQVVEW